MREFLSKLNHSIKYIKRVLFEVLIDLYFYYTSPYPILLVHGAIRRINRRLKYLWYPKGRGRPPVPENIVDLILDMKRSNLLWGAKRIRDELLFLGISLHKKTIRRILKENGFSTPPLKFHPPTWQSLLSAQGTWSMDFTCVIDTYCFQLFILAIIDIDTRELISINVTLHPDRNWIIQQFRNIAIAGKEFPKYLIIDNDGIYGKWIDPALKEYFQIKSLRIARGSPWQNCFSERFNRTLKNEMLNRVFIQSESQVRYLCQKFMKYYNDIRPHQGIQGNVPSKNRVISMVENLETIQYRKVKHLEGLFTEFQIAS